MTDAAPTPPPAGRAARALVLAVLFFFSGAAGLVYQVAWSRRLELTFGSTTYSIGTVLAAYMAGLGLGAWAFGRLADRPGSPVRRYAALEAGIGVYGLLAPHVLDLIETLYVAAGGQGGAVAKAGLGLLALLPPTVLMGGTLPVLVRGLIETRGDAQRATGLLYGVNTLGAVAGATLAGLVVVPWIGMDATSRATGVVNLALAGLALALGRRLAVDIPAPAGPLPAPAGPQPVLADLADLASTVGASQEDGARLRRVAALATTAGCGAVALALEVAWSRAFGLALGSTGHGFTIVLAGTLLGIGAGSLLVARRGGAPDRPLAGLAAALLVLSASCYGFLLAYEHLLAFMFSAAQARALSYEGFLLLQLVVCGGMLLPATLAMGVAFPLAAELGTARVDGSGQALGRLYLANTLGSISGALGGAFLLVPLLGAEGVIRAGVGVTALGGVALVVLAHRRGVWVPPRSTTIGALGAALALAALAAPRWDPTILDAAPTRPRARAVATPDTPWEPGEVWQELHRAGSVLLYAREGLNCYVTVRGSGRDRVLLLGGKPDASTIGDMPTQLMCGVVPFLARPDAKKVLVVGIGSGATARAAADFPGVERVDVVEIEEAVVEAARRYFAVVNEGVLDRPSTRVILEDARTVLLTAPEAEYDVIIGVPTNPWIAGVANLFTLEHYQHARRSLRPGGVYLQWMQLYLTSPWMSQAMLRTYLEAFPHVEVWCGTATDLLLVGSDRPIEHDLDAVRAAVEGNAGLSRDLWPRLRARGPDELFARFLVTGDELRPLVAGGEVLHDGVPRLEGRAARAMYEYLPSGQLLPQLWALAQARGSQWPPLSGPAPPGIDLRVAAARHLVEDAASRPAAQRLLEGVEGPEAATLRAQTLEGAAALRELEAAYAAHPRDPQVLIELAWSLQEEPARLTPLLAALEAQEAGGARRHLLRATSLNPSDPPQVARLVEEVRAGLAALLPREDARALRRRLLDVLVPAAATTPAPLALLDGLVEADADDTDALVVLARALLHAGQLERCLGTLDVLAERHCMRDSLIVRYLRALVLYSADDPGLDDALQRLLELFPGQVENPRIRPLLR